MSSFSGVLSPLHSVLLLVFYFVPLPRTCFSVTSFYISCYIYFYVSHRLLTFPSFEEVVFFRRLPYVPAVHSPLTTQAVCSRGFLWGLYRSLCWGMMNMCVVWQAWLAPVLVSALCGSCQPPVFRTESPNDLLQKSRGPGADVDSLVGGVRVQKTTGRQSGHGVWLQGLRNLVIGGEGGY